jgi:hypothetical protein
MSEVPNNAAWHRLDMRERRFEVLSKSNYKCDIASMNYADNSGE